MCGCGGSRKPTQYLCIVHTSLLRSAPQPAHQADAFGVPSLAYSLPRRLCATLCVSHLLLAEWQRRLMYHRPNAVHTEMAFSLCHLRELKLHFRKPLNPEGNAAFNLVPAQVACVRFSDHKTSHNQSIQRTEQRCRLILIAQWFAGGPSPSADSIVMWLVLENNVMVVIGKRTYRCNRWV